MNFFVLNPSPRWSDAGSSADNDDRADYENHSDARLLERAARGDGAAFTEIVHRHTPALYRVAHRMLGQRVEAEDVVQESFARLWTRVAQWESRGAGPVAWLHRVVVNLCYDRLRSPSGRTTDIFPEIVDASPGPEEALGELQARTLVDATLKSLPERYRAALILSYYEGFPNSLVAEIMELNLKAFESLLLRSRRQMRKMLERQGLSLSDFQVRA